MGGHGQECCTTPPSLFLSRTCGLSPSDGSPPQASWSRPKSFISVGLAVLGLVRTATLFIPPSNALSKSLLIGVSRHYHSTCTNVLRDGSCSPRLALPSSASFRQLEQCSARLSSEKMYTGHKKKSNYTSDGRLPTCHLCSKLHRTCIADIGWCLTFVSAPPIGYDPRAEDLRKHCATCTPQHTGTCYRPDDITPLASLVMSTAAHRQSVALVRAPLLIVSGGQQRFVRGQARSC